MTNKKSYEIRKLVIGLFETNCYILASSAKNAAVIDPADDYKFILKELENHGLTLKKILLTHGHRDHIDACADLTEITGAEVFIHSDDFNLISDYDKSLPYGYFPEKFKPVKKYIPVNDEVPITLDEIEIETVHVPGHTMGGMCYIAGDCMFSGDTLFAGTIGNTGFETGDYNLMMKSLQRLKSLDYNYRVFSGHGKDSRLDDEKRGNPYLI